MFRRHIYLCKPNRNYARLSAYRIQDQNDTHKMCLVLNLGLFLQFLINVREVAAHQGALVGILAASKDKRQQKRLTFVVVNSNRIAILVYQTIVGNFVARLAALVCRLLNSAAPSSSCVITTSSSQESVPSTTYAAAMRFPGLTTPKTQSSFDGKRHGHRGHVVFDLFMRDGDDVFARLD